MSLVEAERKKFADRRLPPDAPGSSPSSVLGTLTEEQAAALENWFERYITGYVNDVLADFPLGRHFGKETVETAQYEYSLYSMEGDSKNMERLKRGFDSISFVDEAHIVPLMLFSIYRSILAIQEWRISNEDTIAETSRREMDERDARLRRYEALRLNHLAWRAVEAIEEDDSAQVKWTAREVWKLVMDELKGERQSWKEHAEAREAWQHIGFK